MNQGICSTSACQGRAAAVGRWSALIGGGTLAIFGLTRRSKSGVALAAAGGALAYLGATVALGARQFFATSTVLLNCSPEEIYRFWHNFENLPLFMRHLESVTQTGPRSSRWVALGPAGARIRWNAEILLERENELIAWRSVEGSEIGIDGSVEFLQSNRGTLVTAIVSYSPPGGAVGKMVARIFGKDPNFMMRQDLRRLKALIETGEIPTTEGQSHGPRSAVAAAAKLFDPDRPLRRGLTNRGPFGQKRGIA